MHVHLLTVESRANPDRLLFPRKVVDKAIADAKKLIEERRLLVCSKLPCTLLTVIGTVHKLFYVHNDLMADVTLFTGELPKSPKGEGYLSIYGRMVMDDNNIYRVHSLTIECLTL